MKQLASDDLRKTVWEALVQTNGNREAAAAHLGKSLRTLNRYIHDLDLYAEMDKAGLMRNAGPPRGVERGVSLRELVIVEYIKDHKGDIDYGELATDMYGEDTPRRRSSVYTALSEMKARGAIAHDGKTWFVIK